MPLNLIFADDIHRVDLFPLALTRPVADIRLGILTIRQKWEKRLGMLSSTLSQDYLSLKYPLRWEEDNLVINGAFIPDDALITACMDLSPDEALISEERIIVRRYGRTLPTDILLSGEGARLLQYDRPVEMLKFPWDIFSMNGSGIQQDFLLITSGRKGTPLPSGNLQTGRHPLFIEEGARVNASIFNTDDGPIYIGQNAEVMEGCMVRGPFVLCDHAVLKMGTKVYGPSTVGPYCKVGGEINNVVFLGYANKAHDGFMGNAVIGEWCNIGADTNNSNLKNTYDLVKMWSYRKEGFINTGLQFCGLIMGDHSKCGINTMFNTGTVVGVSCNVFGPGFQRNFIPCFSWGGVHGFQQYDLVKAMQVAASVFERRGMKFDEGDRTIFEHLHTNAMEMFRK
ncbi:MAG: GlmU family protein [Bacteroidales bacterium]|nr:GlmU family protein [Bacteroidales bacterium]